MNGADIIAAVAFGAKFILIGRAYLYGLMVRGRAGVDRAIDILRNQIERTMTRLGVSSLDDTRAVSRGMNTRRQTQV